MGRLRRKDRERYDHIRRLETRPIDPATGTPGGLEPEDAPVSLTREMLFWVTLDEELVGALDSNGCFHDPIAVNAMLTEYGITETESRKVARRFLRYMGIGRAQALDDDDEE